MGKAKWGVLLALLLAGAAQAQTLTVCAERWLPFIYRDSGGVVRGLAVDALNRAAASRGVSVRYQFLAISGCYRQAASGGADIVAFATAEESPAGWLLTRKPMVYWPLYAWVRRDDGAQRYQGLQQFTGMRVAWVSNYDYPEQMSRHSNWTRVEAQDSYASLTMLAGGRVDVVFDDVQATVDVSRQVGGRVKRLDGLVGSHQEDFSLRPGLAWLRDALDSEAAHMAANGELDAFYRKYFQASWEQVQAVPH